MKFPLASVAAALIVAGAELAAATDLPRVAVFDFELIDTSLDGHRPEQDRRLRVLDEELRGQLVRSGRFEVVDIGPVRERLERGPALSGCNGCEVDMARALDADLALTGTVRKVSNLILNIQLVLTDVPTGARRLIAAADIRGNTDESWLHGLRWLLRNRVLVKPQAGKL